MERHLVVNHPRSQRLLRRIVSVAAIAALTGTAFATTAGASIKPRQTLANITIGGSSSSIIDLPIWVAQADGYFAKEGFNVKLLTLSSSTVIPALVSGSVQFLTASPTTFLQGKLGGQAVEAIANDVVGLSLGLVISSSYAASHGITTKTSMKTVVSDLTGSTGGSSAASLTGAASLLFKEFGGNIANTKVASFASSGAMQASLTTGQINWIVTTQPVPFLIQRQGAGVIVGTPKNVTAWSPSRVGVGQVIAVADSYATSNPGITRNFLRAISLAVIQIRKHELQVLNVAQSNVPGVTRPDLLKTIAAATWPTTLNMNVNRWRTSMAFLIKSGSVKAGTTMVQNVDWTNKFLTSRE